MLFFWYDAQSPFWSCGTFVQGCVPGERMSSFSDLQEWPPASSEAEDQAQGARHRSVSG